MNKEFLETNDNHIGIDINGMESVKSAPASYYENQTSDFKNLTLTRQKIQVWVEYNGEEKQIKVTLAPFNGGKPISPLISLSRDLSTIFNENMFVGFSSANGKFLTSHYVLGWSFKMNGQAQELLLSKLPKLPRIDSSSKHGLSPLWLRAQEGEYAPALSFKEDHELRNFLAMLFKLAILVSLLISLAAGDEYPGFIYNGFKSANLILDGIAQFTANGLLQLTNETKILNGHAFYPEPIPFKNYSNGRAFSFSTTFVFGIHPVYQTLAGHGMAFVIAPTRGLPGARPSQYLGLFNESNNGNASNHVFAVELDTVLSGEFFDINDNHVGIDVNGLHSEISAPAGYYDDQTGDFKNLTLISDQRMQVWVDYNGEEKQINVSLAPFKSDQWPSAGIPPLSTS
ncbi:hypothetical protein Patl1_31828 [Pistacia atlantica]|uniref:Uncharacterized protein n=1 Tax=Pistacia atlantica TaxID=434234 RepID=A0ACC1ANJ4_9ROSI|nr:hypothetical protein Patl1_31828 [Pistacia atlantica]